MRWSAVPPKAGRLEGGHPVDGREREAGNMCFGKEVPGRIEIMSYTDPRTLSVVNVVQRHRKSNEAKKEPINFMCYVCAG